jgi:hypothetical protein
MRQSSLVEHLESNIVRLERVGHGPPGSPNENCRPLRLVPGWVKVRPELGVGRVAGATYIIDHPRLINNLVGIRTFRLSPFVRIELRRPERRNSSPFLKAGMVVQLLKSCVMILRSETGRLVVAVAPELIPVASSVRDVDQRQQAVSMIQNSSIGETAAQEFSGGKRFGCCTLLTASDV